MDDPSKGVSVFKELKSWTYFGLILQILDAKMILIRCYEDGANALPKYSLPQMMGFEF